MCLHPLRQPAVDKDGHRQVALDRDYDFCHDCLNRVIRAGVTSGSDRDPGASQPGGSADGTGEHGAGLSKSYGELNG